MELPGALVQKTQGESQQARLLLGPPASFHWGTGLPQRCVVPSFSLHDIRQQGVEWFVSSLLKKKLNL